MHKPDRIDFEKLLGFELVTRELLKGFDLQDDTIGSRLGAKVGGTEEGTPAKTIQFSKLLGFETIAEELSRGLDFRNDALCDKLGAKVGPPEPISPSRGIDFQNETLGARLGAKVGNEPGGTIS